jgi:hypothetical protein
VRRSTTAVLERGTPLGAEFATEPYEAGWASEALVFLRLVDAPPGTTVESRLQLSPDGMHWVDAGTTLPLLSGDDDLVFGRLREFGNWLRVAGTVSPAGAEARVLIYLVVKE